MTTPPAAIPHAAAEAYANPLLIRQLLVNPLRQSPDQTIVYRGEQRFTYRQLGERVARLGSALGRLGVRASDTVAVADWDSHRYLESYFAVPMIGAVLMSVNVRLSPDQIAYTVDHCEASTLLLHGDFLPLLAQIRARLPKLERVVLLSDTPVTTRPDGIDTDYEALLATGDPAHVFGDFDENTRATTFYTTGTTGMPKGVFFSHRQLVLHTLAVMGALASNPGGQNFNRGDVYMPITPMFHVHAWGMPYVATLLGVKQVYPGRYQPDLLLRLRSEEGVTFSHCVPTILQMLLDAPGSAGHDLRGWKMVIGGAAMTPALARAALGRGIDVFTGYGMSETCPIVALSQLRPGDAGADAHAARTSAYAAGKSAAEAAIGAGDITDAEVARRARTGHAVPLADLRIVDPDMNDAAHDDRAQGEVVVRTPWLTQGYLHAPDAARALWNGGWLHTQDIGRIDASGSLQITDRIKDVIKSGGEWISSLDLEALIARLPAVVEVAVIAVPDPKWSERPLPLVVLRAGAVCTADEVIAHLRVCAERGEISRFAVPTEVRFVEALERTSVGKLNKKRQREVALGR
ncbi:long-chain-fatty-acid--CoA ligase [Derxia gummosa]|uniref:Long-chain-fatty-acid--CoA ligase n=1 Tax=Derxia gummosa DSM 723 TaxID=1121388 RepID=A0A8B6X468_9BURK|nr:long-chain-fatty-acid--CoA ligase [Derxia gummosa]